MNLDSSYYCYCLVISIHISISELINKIAFTIVFSFMANEATELCV